MNSLGIVTLFNTAGAAIGPVLAGFVLLPRFGFQASLFFCGIAYAVLFGPIRIWPDIASAKLLPLAVGAALTMVLAPQVAFAAGLLTVAQAWRLRSKTSAPAAASPAVPGGRRRRC